MAFVFFLYVFILKTRLKRATYYFYEQETIHEYYSSQMGKNCNEPATVP